LPVATVRTLRCETEKNRINKRFVSLTAKRSHREQSERSHFSQRSGFTVATGNDLTSRSEAVSQKKNRIVSYTALGF